MLEILNQTTLQQSSFSRKRTKPKARRNLALNHAFLSFFSSFPSRVLPHLAQNFASNGFRCLQIGHAMVGAVCNADLAFTKTTSPIRSISSKGRNASSSSLSSMTKARLPSLAHAKSFADPILLASLSITSLPMTSSRRRHWTKPKPSSKVPSVSLCLSI